MEEIDEDYDVHLCLRCNTHISGLQNYIQHRKSACRRQMVLQPTQPEDIASDTHQRGSLQPTLLQSTPLQSMSLQSTSLQPASLQPASLQSTSLQPASLYPASLQSTSLQPPASLHPAALQLASLQSTLQPALLQAVPLQPASLQPASLQLESSLQNSEVLDVTKKIGNSVNFREMVCEQLLSDSEEDILKETENEVEEDIEGSKDSEGSIPVTSQQSPVAAGEDYNYSRYLEAKLLGNINTDYKQTRANKQSAILTTKKEKPSKLNLDDIISCKDEDSEDDFHKKKSRKTKSKDDFLPNKDLSPQKTRIGNNRESSNSSDVISDIEENHKESTKKKKSVKQKKKLNVKIPSSTNNSDAKQVKPKRTSKTWTCPVCAKVLRARAGLVHMRIHSGDKPFKCHLCKYASITQSDLRMHMKRHLGIKEFKCPECDYATSRRSLLRTHSHRHQREKGLEDLLYQCDECGKRYASIYGLKGHIKAVHENFRPFTCSFENCKYAGVSNCELQIHIRTHTKEKPFLCTQCGYKAANKNRLMRHMITHTDAKPFKCDYPGCAFIGKTAFRVTRHKRQHDPGNRLFCPYCSYTTFYIGNLRKHIKNTAKHKDTKVYLCDICKVFQTDVYKDLINHYDDVHKGDVEVSVHSGGLKLGQFNNSRQTQDVNTEDTIIIIPEEAIIIENNVEFTL